MLASPNHVAAGADICALLLPPSGDENSTQAGAFAPMAVRQRAASGATDEAMPPQPAVCTDTAPVAVVVNKSATGSVVLPVVAFASTVTLVNDASNGQGE